MEKLRKFRDDIKGKVEVGEREGYKPKPDVIKWMEDICKLEEEWESMQESIATAKKFAYACRPKCILLKHKHRTSKINFAGLSRLEKTLVVEMKKVEFIPGTSIEGQSATIRNLNELLRLLEDEKVYIISVWGKGGVGRTTLVKNLNNELLKPDASESKLSFGVVVWFTVPKPPKRKVQAQMASRLNLNIDNEGSVESMASKIYERLMEIKVHGKRVSFSY